jgi:hypothetical protein
MILFLDARFNKGLIENCQLDIDKYCRSEVVDDDDDGKDSDGDDTENDGKLLFYLFTELNDLGFF